MLAKPGEPFDSPDYLFEIKWDGTRALAFIDAGSVRLVNRRRVAMNDRYPELQFLAELPPGTVLDGEIVVLRDGKPDFQLLQSREQARTPIRVRLLAKAQPATYVVFDQLYDSYRPLMALPLHVRRERLGQLVRAVGSPHLVLSEGVVGDGVAFFQETCRRGLEGVVAKRLQSQYQPDKRTDAWIKIKRREAILCVVIGFQASGQDDFRSLILASDTGGELRCVGKVGTGFDAKMRARLNGLLWERLRAKPIIPCTVKGKWVEPGIYCRVSYLERTVNGELRAPVFEGLVSVP